MNREQYLLMKLAEEASEVAQIALKTAQFGLEETKPLSTRTNMDRTHEELNDLLAVVEMLNYECGFKFSPSEGAIKHKKSKVAKYYLYSRELGLVD